MESQGTESKEQWGWKQLHMDPFVCRTMEILLTRLTPWLTVIKPAKGRIQLPSSGSDWKLECKKIKSTNARGRAIILSFDDQCHPLDRIQVSFPIICDANGAVDRAVDDGKLFVKAIQRALEERRSNKSVTEGLPKP